MGIPYARQYTANTSGAVLKTVKCESCNTEFVCLARRQGTGSGFSLLFLDNEGAADRAAGSAERDLRSKLDRAVDVVPCPQCGRLQYGMVRCGERCRFWVTLGIGLFVATLLFLRGLAIYWFDPIANAGNLPAAQKWPVFVAAMTSIYVYLAIAVVIVSLFGSILWCTIYNPNGASHRKLAARAAASGGVALTAVRDRLSGVPPEARASAVMALFAEREQAAKPSPGLQQEHLWLGGLIALILVMVGVGFVVALRSRAEHTRHARDAVERAAQALNAADLPKCRSELLQSWQVAADSGSKDVRGQWEQLAQTCLDREFAEVRRLMEGGQLRSAQQRLADGQVRALLGKANRPGLRQTEEELKQQIQATRKRLESQYLAQLTEYLLPASTEAVIVETLDQATVRGKSTWTDQKYDHVDLRVRVANASEDTVVQVKVAGSLVLIADPESTALTLLHRNPIRRIASISQSISVVVPPRDVSVATLPFELDPPLDSSRLFRGDVKSFLAELSVEQVRVVRWNSETAATFADLKNKYLALGASLPGELACAAEACDSALHEAQVLSELTVSSLGECPEFWAGAGAFDARRDRVLMWGSPLDDAELMVLDLNSRLIRTLQVKGTGPSGTTAPAVAIDSQRDTLYVFGGWADGADAPEDEMYRLDLAAEPLTWERMPRAKDGPAGRNGACLVYDPKGDGLLLYAGDGGPGEESFTPLDDLWRFDLSAGRWQQLRPQGIRPPARWHASMACDEASGLIYMFGGCGLGAQAFDRELYVYDPRGNQWHKTDVMGRRPPSLQGGSLSFDVRAGLLVLCGGLRHEEPGEATLSSVWVYAPKARRWAWRDGGELARRRDHVAVYDPSRACHYLVGGRTSESVGDWYESGRPVRSAVELRLTTDGGAQ